MRIGVPLESGDFYRSDEFLAITVTGVGGIGDGGLEKGNGIAISIRIVTFKNKIYRIPVQSPDLSLDISQIDTVDMIITVQVNGGVGNDSVVACIVENKFVNQFTGSKVDLIEDCIVASTMNTVPKRFALSFIV